MSVVCLGISHHTAPAEVRERHAFHGGQVGEALITLLDYEKIKEAAILSTCNRLEIYAEVDEIDRGIAQLKQFLGNFRHGGVPYDIEPYLYTLVDRAAIDHLLRVSTGLDSMLLGENEILGQVREAYIRAQAARSFGVTLHRLFREALNAGKAARSQTDIGGDSVSIATAAVNYAREHIGTLRGKGVLLIGAGQMGLKAAKRLKIEGTGSLVVANRTYERAQELCTRLGMGSATEFHNIDGALQTVDVVITSTVATHFVLNRENIGKAMQSRQYRPLCVVDIAVPRNVEPQVARIPGVRLIDIDQLGLPVDLALERRRSAIPAVEEIIRTHLQRFEAWYDKRETIPVISAFSKKAETIRQAEIERLFARCPYFGERERSLITGATLRILSKLMHPAYSSIRDSSGEQAAIPAAIIDELFDLGIGRSYERS
jgi:glutamyl-tRNA reductase